jgi:sulfoxide reductase heme-binding subunit YedZ
MQSISNRKSGFYVSLFGVVTFLAAYINIYTLQHHNQSAAAVGMSDMHMDRMSKFWAMPLIQASGMAAIFASYLAIILGLQQSRRAVGWLKLKYQEIDSLHRHLSILVLILVAVHAVSTYLDTTGSVCRGAFWFNQCTKPWPQAVWAYNLGIFAFYLAVILGPTFYLRRKLGVQAWKYAHRFILIFYVASVWHTLILGIAVQDYPTFFRPLFWLAQIPVLLLIARRFEELASSTKGSTGSTKYFISKGVVLVSYAGVLFVIGVLASHHSMWLNIT